MTITFYGPDAAGMNSFMCLDQGVNRFLSLYNNIVVLSSWLSMVIILLNYFIKETFLICCRVIMEDGIHTW